MKIFSFTAKSAKLLSAIILLAFLVTPFATHAQFFGLPNLCPAPPDNFKEVVCVFVNILLLLVPFLASLALLAFFWGIVKFIRSAGSESAREDAKNIMFWGIIALFVMVSIWGIVQFFFQDFFGGAVGIHPFGIPQLPIFKN